MTLAVTLFKNEPRTDAYLSFCVIVRNEAKNPAIEKRFRRCLESIRERAPEAEIVVVDTMSSDDTAKIASEYADVVDVWPGPQGTWTPDMLWFDDAASARQHAFELASGRVRGWIDADDRLAGPEEAERLLKLNGQWCPSSKHAIDPGQGSPMSLVDALKIACEEHGVDCIWAPYLYQRDADGHAITWQARERFVVWGDPPKWRWAERAHEVLVPISGHQPKRAEFSHLLFVHEKEFSDADYKYGIARHFEVLERQYQDGDVTTRRCLYLGEYARSLCPNRIMEFLDAGEKAATTPLDRHRVLIQKANTFSDRGLPWDALAAYSAAVAMRPDLPDGWIAGGERWALSEDHIRAVEWLREGAKKAPNALESYIPPRHLQVRYPTLLAEELVHLARLEIRAGLHEQAARTLQEATEKAIAVRNFLEGAEDGSEDVYEAVVRLCRISNEWQGHIQAIHLADLGNYLFANDEPAKVRSLIDSVPWNLTDHPLVVALERRVRPIVEHMESEACYFEFYDDAIANGFTSSPDHWLDPRHIISPMSGHAGGSTLRSKWIGEYLRDRMPKARVLDVGCYDGIVGVPVLAYAPEITYVGLEPFADAVAMFRKRIEDRNLGARAIVVQGRLEMLEREEDRHDVIRIFDGRLCGVGDDREERIDEQHDRFFDAIIWTEVIEHVPDPAEYLIRLRHLLRPEGVIFITTPWGAFDAGHPPPTTKSGDPRDSRGHLRVYTAASMQNEFSRLQPTGNNEPFACLRAEEIEHVPMPVWSAGDAMHVLARHTEDPPMGHPVSFVVPGALWDWNGRTVREYGMGASEAMIVHLAERLTNESLSVNVFGPTADPTVHRSVGYHRQECVRHHGGDWGTFVISRGPGYAKVLDEMLLNVKARRLPKVLWLQDAFYPDLTPENAERFQTIVVASEWHKEAMHKIHGIPFEKMVVAYNYLLRDEWRWEDAPERKPDHFVYASSPDRGLVRLLELWPRIKQALPGATLDVFYGWRGCEKLGMGTQPDWTKRYERARRAFEDLRHQPGILVHGMVPQTVVNRAFQRAGVWAYPSGDAINGRFQETCCRVALVARAGGAIPVCPPEAALAETAACDEGVFIDIFDDDGFIDACVAASTVGEEERRKMSKDVLALYDEDVVFPIWKKVLGL